MSDVSQLSDDELKALYAQPAAPGLSGMSDYELKALHTDLIPETLTVANPQFAPPSAPSFNDLESRVAQRRAAESGATTNWARPFLDELTAGWEPYLAGKAGSAMTGRPASDIQAEEKALLKASGNEAPIQNFLASLFGGGAQIALGGEALRGLGAGPALDWVGNQVSRLPYLTSGGREAATAATAAGRAATPSLMANAATGALMATPAAVSKRIADDGLTFSNAALGTIEGTLGGASGGALLHGAGEFLRPWGTNAARELIAQDVPITPGQVFGGGVQRAEGAVAEFPILGGFTRGALERSQDGFARKVIERPLDMIGERLPAARRTGTDAMAYVNERLNSAYRDALSRVSAPARIFNPAQGFPWAATTDQLVRAAQLSGMRQEGIRELMQTIQDVNIQVANGTLNGRVPGAVFQRIQSNLRGQARNLRDSGNTAMQNAAPYVDQLQEAVRNYVTQSGSGAGVQRLRDVDQAFAHYVVLQRASNSANKTGGVFNADQLADAAKLTDSSIRNNRTATGQELYQDLSRPGTQTLQRLPDQRRSSFEDRALLLSLLGGGAAMHASPAALALGAVAPMLYSPPAKAAIRAFGGRGEAWRNPLAGAVQRFGNSTLPSWGVDLGQAETDNLSKF